MEELQRHREVLAINRAIASAEEYDEVLRLVVDRTAAFTGATACLLLLVHEDDGLARVVRSIGVDPERSSRLAVPLSERIDAELCSLLGFQSVDGFVGVPVIGKQGVMGILAVYRQAPQGPDPGRDELISAFADQAAIALDNAERVRRLREARDREASRQRALLLAAVTEELNRGVGLQQVFDVAIRRGVQVLGRKDGALYLLEPGGRHLRGFSEVWDRGRTGAVIALDDTPNVRRTLDTLQPHFFTYDEAGPVEREWMRRLGIRGRLVLPLILEERCAGFLFINYEREQDRPSPDDVDFARALASQCALAIGRARAYEAERDARVEAEATARIQEQLMAVVGHDLRTPLSAITMAATVMFKRGELPPAQALSLARISSAAARMSSIIRDLLDFSRARQGLAIAIQGTRFDLGDVCRRVLVEFEEGGDEPTRRLSLVTEGDLQVFADESRLGQALSNLVGNALQHGGPHVDVRAVGRGEDVTITVHNDGPPIPAEVMPYIFEPFRRGARTDDHAETSASSSIGLGLFIVREVVKAHGGTVEVRSDAETGTIFTIHLARALPGEDGA